MICSFAFRNKQNGVFRKLSGSAQQAGIYFFLSSVNIAPLLKIFPSLGVYSVQKFCCSTGPRL